MNNLRLIIIGLLIPAILMIPYSIFSFYTDFANKNPDPALITVDFNSITFNAIEGKKTFEQYQCMGAIPLLGTAPTSDQTLPMLMTGLAGAMLRFRDS